MCPVYCFTNKSLPDDIVMIVRHLQRGLDRQTYWQVKQPLIAADQADFPTPGSGINNTSGSGGSQKNCFDF